MENMKEQEVLSLNAAQLISWCKERKKSLGISNQKLSELTGVPIGTIDRILAGKYNEYRYSSIQPIVSVLIGFKDATPEPDEGADPEQSQYYYDTIEGYRLVVENKNREIERLTSKVERLFRELEFVKRENEQKQIIIERYHENVVWLQGIIDGSTKTKTKE